MTTCTSKTMSYKRIVDGYIADIAAASNSSTNVFSVATQYYQMDTTAGAPQEHIHYSLTEGAEVDDTTPYPSPGGCPSSVTVPCVSDADVQAELRSLASNRNLTVDDSHLYMLLLPSGVEACEGFDSTLMLTPCSSDANDGFCAYHSSTASSPYLIYGNVLYPDLAACADPVRGPQAPNGDQQGDAAVSLVSHEANEAITDWDGTWMDKASYENGDECNFVFGVAQGTAGAMYNQTVNGGHYYTQDEFSNEDYTAKLGDAIGSTQVYGCVQREELPNVVWSTPINASSNTSLTFDGSASTDADNSPLSFSWTWGDGTSRATTAIASHTYCSPGSYNVALTVTDGGGWNASTSRSVTVSEGPPVVTGIAPGGGTPEGGTTVAIQGCSLTASTGVRFGAAAASFVSNSDTSITATSPAVSSAGTVDITVITPVATSAVVPADRYMYSSFIEYFNWFDTATSGMAGDNIHLLNTGAATATVHVTVGTQSKTLTVAAGAETYTSFPNGTIGGPVTVVSDQRVLASQRVQYFSSFNEVWAMSPSQAATTLYIPWFDTATPGMVGDNLHVLNPGANPAHVTISIPSLPGVVPIVFDLAAGAESHQTFPVGTIGGPVQVTSTQPVLVSQRVQYYQTFNEAVGHSPAEARPTGYFNWFDRATAGMVGDNIHLVNPGTTDAHVRVSLGALVQAATVPAGEEVHVSFGPGQIGGPVSVVSDQPVLASQRVQYYQSFNEVGMADSSQAAKTLHLMWFDSATYGMFGDNVHVLNTGTANATVQVAVGAVTRDLVVPPGGEAHATFDPGTIGGPVLITSDQPVLAAQRVQYFQTFNETAAR